MDSGDSGSGSSSSQKCATPFHRHTIDVVHPAPERPQQQKRYSEDTALAPLRPIAGPSNVRYNTPHSQATHLRLFEQSHALAQDQVQNPSRRALIDSGFITTTPISQSQRSSTVDMSTRLSQLIPSTEDRPDLWQDDQVAPTFRPRNPSNTGDGSSNTGDGSPRRNRRDWSRARSSPLTRYVWYILLLLGYSPESRYKDERRIVAITLAIETLLVNNVSYYLSVFSLPMNLTLISSEALWECSFSLEFVEARFSPRFQSGRRVINHLVYGDACG